jgi:23S rRNA (adenine2503-C2)-methyltransferase
MKLAALETLVAEWDLPKYRAEQLYTWIHRRGASSTEEMTNLSKDLRSRISKKADLRPLEVKKVVVSEDGTKKLRLHCTDGAVVESVLIPNDGKITQCLSTQVGCALGCNFCATATLGLKRNLSVGEIVDQVYRAQRLLEGDERITNLVYMGMGEPMANLECVLDSVDILCSEAGADFSPRRITISTSGHVPGIKKMGNRAANVGLAISLHAVTDELRDKLMPINKRWPLAVLLKTLREYPLPRRRRITFEYILFAGLNDSRADAKRLVALLDRIPAKVNLLAYNPLRKDHPDLKRPDDDTMEQFAEWLRDKDISTTVRRSRGMDIAAACGQLALEDRDS